MQETREVELFLFHTGYNWVDIAPIPTMEENELVITSNFDYEMLPDDTKRIYVEIGLKTYALAIEYRTGVEFDGEEFAWTDIFNHNFIHPVVELAIKNCRQAYYDFCEEHSITYPHNIEINEEQSEGIASTIVNQYVSYRRFTDEKNEYLISTPGLEFEIGTDVELVFECTFAILDEILFTNPAFDRAHNIEVFTDHVYIQRYSTIKQNCTQPEDEVVELSLFDSVMFLESLSCALQMLVGDKSDMVEAILERKGIDKEQVKSYIKVGTGLFAQFCDMLESSNARILNLENQPDWNRLIR
jgi:hypothetical protein